jgi:hypothetical protein
MRRTVFALAALAMAAPLAAQQMAGMDMTNKVKGSGQLPAGWMMRFDPPRQGPMPEPTEVNVVTMGTGLHFTSGPAAIYYNPKDMGTGEYSVTATMSQRKSMGHEAYGIFIGGKNLQDSTQSYVYFLAKPCRSRGDCKDTSTPLGEIMISARSSNGRPTALLASVHDDAVHADDPTDGHATNKFTIHVARDTVHFFLNDKLVKALAKSQLGMSTDGQAGVRINHNSDVHVAWGGVSK